MDKQNVLHDRLEHYSAIKWNEILTHATAWKNLEDIILSERTQSHKDKYCMILFV